MWLGAERRLDGPQLPQVWWLHVSADAGSFVDELACMYSATLKRTCSCKLRAVAHAAWSMACRPRTAAALYVPACVR